MSYRIPNGAGSPFNTAANWDQGTNAPTIHASTNITITSGGVSSLGFTAPNLVNAATGVVLPIAAVGSAGTLTFKLQLAGVDVVGATGTIAVTSLRASTKVTLRFGTPVVFTSLAAGTYTIRLSIAGGSGTTSVCADSGAANFSYIATDDRHVVPTTGDDIIGGGPGQVALTIDLDTSPSIGSGTNTAIPAFRSYGNGIDLSNLLCLAYDITTSRTITCKGNVLLSANGGELRFGTSGAKIPLGVSAELVFDENGTTLNHGLVKETGGKFIAQSTALTYKKTTVASGVGTAASPLVFADAVDWTVGDELVFTPGTDSATNYNESEVRFIITKNSATSYVLSTTAGGAEAALTFTHALSSAVFNLTRQIKISTTDITKSFYGNFVEGATVGNLDIDGIRFETIGGATANKTNINFATINPRLGTIDDMVVYRVLTGGVFGVQLSNDRTAQSYSWWIAYSCAISGNGGAFNLGGANKTFTNFHAIACQGAGYFAAGANMAYYSCGAWATGISSATAISGFYFINATKIFLSDCDSHSARSYGNELSTAAYMIATNCRYGTRGKNGGADVDLVAASSDNMLFDNCSFGSDTLINGYTGMNNGSEIAFHRFNQVDNDHRWYLTEGIGRSTGAALADTTVRTAGSLGLRIAPESTSPGFVWTFSILARAGAACSITGFIKKNVAFGTDDCDIELYLPGLTPGVDTPSATQSMPDDTEWNVFGLVANYTGAVDLYATVRLVAKTATASAYVYVDDLYNGTNPITAMDVWQYGKPSPIMFEQLGDAAAVWGVARAAANTSGTFGEYVNAELTEASETEVVDSVWDEALSGHTTTGTTGKKLNTTLTRNGFITGSRQ